MIFYKTDEEIELIRESCLLVCKTLAHVAGMLKPGVTGLMLDKEAETFIRDHKATPAFKGYRDFPASLCISLNEAVVHGIPSNREFKETDIISIDCGTCLAGYYGDAAYTFALSGVSDVVMQLLEVTNTSLYKGIEQAVVGKRIGDIGFAVQDYCERVYGYGIVRELVGHGVGRSLHEEPDVPNYGRRGQGPKILEGLVIAIEPMVNMGTKDVIQENDGWTIVSKDRKPSAHFEHTIAVRKNKPDILSDHRFIEDAIKNNAEIRKVSIKN